MSFQYRSLVRALSSSYGSYELVLMGSKLDPFVIQTGRMTREASLTQTNTSENDL